MKWTKENLNDSFSTVEKKKKEYQKLIYELKQILVCSFDYL